MPALVELGRKNESSAIIADDALGDSLTQSIRMRFWIHTGYGVRTV
jgi:hypothetical protein